ncbi:MAG: RdgB/HAM1 family non-canonical purine NTP pyrophosphatase [Alphaproteobacteria bacterium]|nr:RdgB/HAM1 family non-canonical purine NTP pyrophosphatase [Alphaproteobacteria bacterium]
MTRRFEGGRLVIASHNQGKVREIGDLLAPLGAEVISAGELNLPEPEETGTTFAENAALKARAAALASGHPALADDSGLAVVALNGAPGIHSARYAKQAGGFEPAMEQLWRSLAPHADKSAYFVCALAIAWPDGHCDLYEGRVDGQLVWPLRGRNGFGFDPIFQPRSFDLTFGEMEPAAKHAISHRADAFHKLVAGAFAA